MGIQAAKIYKNNGKNQSLYRYSNLLYALALKQKKVIAEYCPNYLLKQQQKAISMQQALTDSRVHQQFQELVEYKLLFLLHPKQ